MLGKDPELVKIKLTKSITYSNDALISPWLLFRYCVIGGYVGVATVMASR